MAVDTVSPRSRRAILAATLGGVAGTVLARLGGPESVRATNGTAIILGNSPSGTLDGTGINEASLTTGIYTTTGIGFVATSPFGVGVFGNSDSNVGVYGQSTSNVGVYGNTSSSIGVYGASNATDSAAVAGRSFGNSTGRVAL